MAATLPRGFNTNIYIYCVDGGYFRPARSPTYRLPSTRDILLVLGDCWFRPKPLSDSHLFFFFLFFFFFFFSFPFFEGIIDRGCREAKLQCRQLVVERYRRLYSASLL